MDLKALFQYKVKSIVNKGEILKIIYTYLTSL